MCRLPLARDTLTGSVPALIAATGGDEAASDNDAGVHPIAADGVEPQLAQEMARRVPGAAFAGKCMPSAGPHTAFTAASSPVPRCHML